MDVGRARNGQQTRCTYSPNGWLVVIFFFFQSSREGKGFFDFENFETILGEFLKNLNYSIIEFRIFGFE